MDENEEVNIVREELSEEEKKAKESDTREQFLMTEALSLTDAKITNRIAFTPPSPRTKGKIEETTKTKTF